MLEPKKVFADKVGTGESEEFRGLWYPNVVALLGLECGKKANITIALEGSMDGEEWVETVSDVFTHGSAHKLVKPPDEWYPVYRLNITKNKNVKVNAWIGAGGA